MLMCWELLAVSATPGQETRATRCQRRIGEPRITEIEHICSLLCEKGEFLGRGRSHSHQVNSVQFGLAGKERASFVIQRVAVQQRRGELLCFPPDCQERPSNPRPLHLSPPCTTDNHHRITTAPDPILDFTIAALLYLPTVSNDQLVPPCAHTVTSRSCFGNIPLLILSLPSAFRASVSSGDLEDTSTRSSTQKALPTSTVLLIIHPSARNCSRLHGL